MPARATPVAVANASTLRSSMASRLSKLRKVRAKWRSGRVAGGRAAGGVVGPAAVVGAGVKARSCRFSSRRRACSLARSRMAGRVIRAGRVGSSRAKAPARSAVRAGWACGSPRAMSTACSSRSSQSSRPSRHSALHRSKSTTGSRWRRRARCSSSPLVVRSTGCSGPSSAVIWRASGSWPVCRIRVGSLVMALLPRPAWGT